MKTVYGLLVVIGIVLPYWQLVPWVADHGVAPLLLFQEAARSRIGAFAWLDVIVSAIALIGFVWYEGRRLGMKRLWLPVVGTCAVGVSCGLPLFLWMRERHLEGGQSFNWFQGSSDPR